VRVFAGMCGSRDTGLAEDVFLESGLVGGKTRTPGSMLFSLSSNSEWNGKLDVSLGPADVCGRRKGFVRNRQTGGGGDLVGFGMASVDAPK
jgi:hypothetical protein